MSESCNHDCENCASKCDEAEDKNSFLAPMNALSEIKKVIGVVSGKGGVGKSLVTSMLAVEMRRRGYSVGILDADITGPSIPKLFGITGNATSDNMGIYPALSRTGIEVMSVNLLLENEGDPVIWRGPIIAGAVKQFWTDVIWEDVDYLFVDMPPGTGDVPLTVFQSLPVDGIVVVTSPQELVSMIVGKAVKMADMMNIPVLGIVENMSYYVCPDCGAKHSIFGESNVDKTAEKFGIANVAKLPLDPKLSAACDKGMIELFECEEIKIINDALTRDEK
ncbi:MAG: Mrp/NBP35 family ATP-binding protein [Clostridia bacterium]|nr:Mrp/NBP35 family ATP-binding protein [Clostridia bacterium]